MNAGVFRLLGLEKLEAPYFFEGFPAIRALTQSDL